MSKMKKCQVAILPSIVKAKLVDNTNKLELYSNLEGKDTWLVKDGYVQHLYILSNDEIKEGDWVCNRTEIYQAKSYYGFQPISKKIIATTDTSLTVKAEQAGENAWYNPLPQPSIQFIQKYVEEYNKGSQIVNILVEYEEY